MNAEEIHNKLKEKFGDSILEFNPQAVQLYVKLSPKSVLDVARFMKDDEELAFDCLMCLSSVDYPESIEVVYHFYSNVKGHKCVLKVEVPRENGSVPSVESVWRTADWHEREAYDLVGVVFEDHPDLRRILLPEDWEGYPLRKDYQVQEFYRGMRVPYDEDLDPNRGTFIEPMFRKETAQKETESEKEEESES